jgi:hypothetical protein
MTKYWQRLKAAWAAYRQVIAFKGLLDLLGVGPGVVTIGGFLVTAVSTMWSDLALFERVLVSAAGAIVILHGVCFTLILTRVWKEESIQKTNLYPRAPAKRRPFLTFVLTVLTLCCLVAMWWTDYNRVRLKIAFMDPIAFYFVRFPDTPRDSMDIVIDADVANSGNYPTIAYDYRLTVKTVEGETFRVNRPLESYEGYLAHYSNDKCSHSVFRFELCIPSDKQGVLASLLAFGSPIPPGNRIGGYIIFRVKGVDLNGLDHRGTGLRLEVKDSTGRRYHVDANTKEAHRAP